jgi:hypothetical protein
MSRHLAQQHFISVSQGSADEFTARRPVHHTVRHTISRGIRSANRHSQLTGGQHVVTQETGKTGA